MCVYLGLNWFKNDYFIFQYWMCVCVWFICAWFIVIRYPFLASKVLRFVWNLREYDLFITSSKILLIADNENYYNLLSTVVTHSIDRGILEDRIIWILGLAIGFYSQQFD